MRFRKKPIVIEAISVADAIDAAAAGGWGYLPDWLLDPYAEGKVLFRPDAVVIDTLEGSMRGGLGDYIICGVKGELYPCRGDIFEQTYELVEDVSSG